MYMKRIIVDLLSKHINLEKEEIEKLIEIPPSSELGDYAFPCFVLAEKEKKNPIQISSELAGKIELPAEISQVKAVGAYLNFFVNKNFLAQKTIKEIIKQKENFGKPKKTKKEKIVIEFLSPNTNKPLHIGHLRNMAIGESVSRILESEGNRVIRTNLYNDRGIQICKSMLAYKKFGNNKKPNKKPDHFVGDFYVLFNKKVAENQDLEKEAQELLRKWEAKDKETFDLWKKMNSWAIKGIKDTYKKFGIKFDKDYYESKIYEKGKEIIQEGLRKGLFRKREDNAIVVNLGELGEKVLLRKDSTSIYITQDLYLAKLKYQDYKFDKSIYVVANEQNYHFKVLFKILKMLNYEFSDRLVHLSYGMVNLPEGRMKSREGKVVDADDLIEEMENLAIKELNKRYKLNKNELKRRARKIALSSIKYFLLKTDAVKDITFNPEEAINFEGNSGPYLQYSYARASSILKKAKKKLEIKFVSLKPQEISLIKKLAEFPEIMKKAATQINPVILANYAFDLCQKFNEFYHSCPVIGSEEESCRLSLVLAFKIVVKSVLYMLGIEVLERM